MYPTLASSKPLLPKSFLYMCSMPQKHPAARMAVSAPSGTCIVVWAAWSGANRIEAELNGLVSFWKMEFMAKALTMPTIKIDNCVRGFTLAVDGV